MGRVILVLIIVGLFYLTGAIVWTALMTSTDEILQNEYTINTVWGIVGGIGSVISILPWLVALLRKVPNVVQIFLVNVFLGWTFIGWVVALVWAFKPLKE